MMELTVDPVALCKIGRKKKREDWEEVRGVWKLAEPSLLIDFPRQLPCTAQSLLRVPIRLWRLVRVHYTLCTPIAIVSLRRSRVFKST